MSDLKTKIKETLLKRAFDLQDFTELGSNGLDHLQDYGRQGLEHLQEYGNQGLEHLQNYGRESMDYLQNAGQQGLQFAQDNPKLTAAGVGAGALGLAGTLALKRLLQNKLGQNSTAAVAAAGAKTPGILDKAKGMFNQLPTSGKIGLGLGAGALGYMGYNALTGNSNKHKKTITIS